MRAFLGVELDAEWKDRLVAVITHLRNADPAWDDATWVARENLHVTLKFLGEISEETGSALVRDLAPALATMRSFELPCAVPVKSVPTARHAKMLWTQLDDPEGRGAEVVGTIDSTAVAYGIEPEGRTYTPHITLARARRPSAVTGTEEIAAVFAAHGGEGESVSVREVTLYSSQITRRGPIYEILARVPLGKG